LVVSNNLRRFLDFIDCKVFVVNEFSNNIQVSLNLFSLFTELNELWLNWSNFLHGWKSKLKLIDFTKELFLILARHSSGLISFALLLDRLLQVSNAVIISWEICHKVGFCVLKSSHFILYFIKSCEVLLLCVSELFDFIDIAGNDIPVGNIRTLNFSTFVDLSLLVSVLLNCNFEFFGFAVEFAHFLVKNILRWSLLNI